jgi:DNA-binding response OmpR family regulator
MVGATTSLARRQHAAVLLRASAGQRPTAPRPTQSSSRRHDAPLHAVRPKGQRRRRVLVVDDESAIRTLCRVNLELEGFDVLVASDGDEALALVEREKPDLVLLDVMMPDLDGWEVAERLRQKRATEDIPIVFLSARAAHADRQHGYDVGALAYVVKPFDPVALPNLIREVIERVARGEREQLRQELLEER